jgi:hypothetical protein
VADTKLEANQNYDNNNIKTLQNHQLHDMSYTLPDNAQANAAQCFCPAAVQLLVGKRLEHPDLRGHCSAACAGQPETGSEVLAAAGADFTCIRRDNVVSVLQFPRCDPAHRARCRHNKQRYVRTYVYIEQSALKSQTSGFRSTTSQHSKTPELL